MGLLGLSIAATSASASTEENVNSRWEGNEKMEGKGKRRKGKGEGGRRVGKGKEGVSKGGDNRGVC